MKSGYSVDKIWQLTKIDKWFLNKLMHIIDLEGIVSSVHILLHLFELTSFLAQSLQRRHHPISACLARKADGFL